MIYLSSPYSHPQAYVRQLRYAHAMHVTAELVRRGKLVYSPVVHFHPVALHHQLPTDFDFWENICLGMMRLASEVYVLKLDEWQASIGVANELSCAERCLLPITYLEADEWLK